MAHQKVNSWQLDFNYIKKLTKIAYIFIEWIFWAAWSRQLYGKYYGRYFCQHRQNSRNPPRRKGGKMRSLRPRSIRLNSEGFFSKTFYAASSLESLAPYSLHGS